MMTLIGVSHILKTDIQRLFLSLWKKSVNQGHIVLQTKGGGGGCDPPTFWRKTIEIVDKAMVSYLLNQVVKM